MADPVMYMVRDPAGAVVWPANTMTLRPWGAAGRVFSAMHIAPVGTSAWQPIWTHPELADLFLVQLAATQPVAAPAASNATTHAATTAPAPSVAPAQGSGQSPPPVPEKQAIDKGREAAVG